MAATGEVARVARTLLHEHGLGHVPFEFDRAKARYGACWYRGGKAVKISLSEPMCQVNTLERCTEVILHEIAHALAGRAAGHGPVWRATARRIGLANPKTCASHHDTEVPRGNYNAYCAGCSETKPIAVRTKAPKPDTIYRCLTHRLPIVWLPPHRDLAQELAKTQVRGLDFAV